MGKVTRPAENQKNEIRLSWKVRSSSEESGEFRCSDETRKLSNKLKLGQLDLQISEPSSEPSGSHIRLDGPTEPLLYRLMSKSSRPGEH
jgi:hypothetical protein